MIFAPFVTPSSAKHACGHAPNGSSPTITSPSCASQIRRMSLPARSASWITGVGIDKDDAKVVVLKCSKRPEGEVYVTYAHAAAPGEGPYPANRGALRGEFGEGAVRRWALPARLKLTGG